MTTPNIELFDILTFVFLVVYLIIMLILAALFLRKYFQVGKIELLYSGLLVLTFSFSNTIHWIISFLFLVIADINLDPYLLFGVQGISLISIIFWFLAFQNLVLKNNPKKTLITSTIIATIIILTIIYYIALLISPTFIGNFDETGWSVLVWTPLAGTIFLICYLIFFGSFLMFIIHALRTPDKTIQLKGKLLLVASIFLGVSITATLLLLFFSEGIMYWIISLLFVHLSRIIAFIFFYIGFALPEAIKRVLLK